MFPCNAKNNKKVSLLLLSFFLTVPSLGYSVENTSTTDKALKTTIATSAVDATVQSVPALPVQKMTEALKLLKADKVQTITFNKKDKADPTAVLITTTDGTQYSVTWAKKQDGKLWAEMLETTYGIYKGREDENPWITSMLNTVWSGMVTLAFFALLIMFMIWFQLKATRIMTSANQKPINPKDISISFDDIAGIDEAKNDVQEVLAFLNDKSTFDGLGAKIPKGILLVGEPGGGKTMLAKAFAKSCDAAFYGVSGSEFVEMYVGLGAARIRSLFKKARKHPRAVIFIDEIDAFGKKRGGQMSHGEVEQTLNQLLVEMDGFDHGKTDLVIIAATNRLEVLDEALLRPGRFDRHIMVQKPSLKGRKDILDVYIKKAKKVSDDINLQDLARQTVGLSAADLSNLVNEALLRAAKRKSSQLEQQDLLDAREKLLLGDPRMDITLVANEKRTTAYHEAGHTVLALATSGVPVERVSIRPRGNSLGQMLQVPNRESFSITHHELKSKLQVLMGGRAAEELAIGSITTGAGQDMEVAYTIARNMVTSYGFGKTLGTCGVRDSRQLSEGTRQSLEQEAMEIVQESYSEALQYLKEHESALKAIAELLLEQEDIAQKELLVIWTDHTNKTPSWAPLSLSKEASLLETMTG